MKILAALTVGVTVWYVLGHVAPITGCTAIVLTILGKYGAVSYKVIAGLLACGATHNRI